MSEPGPRRISYAQNGEDVRAWRALRDVPDVFYAEVGASHPFDHSLTAALSAEGWRGVLIEPEPAAAELLRVARPRDVVVAAAASDEPGVLQWVNDGDRGEGRIAEDRQGLAVPVVRLGDVLDGLAVQDVHFMSVDVEGHERRALLGLDLSRWKPWVMCVEATTPLTRIRTHEAWEPLLLDAGYRFVAFDGLNRWYVSPEHAELADAVAEPFGVLDIMLDGWQRRDVVDHEARLHEVVAEVDRLREEHHGQLRREAELLDEVAGLQKRLRESEELADRRLNELERQTGELKRQTRELEGQTRELEGQARELEGQARDLTALQRELELVAAQRDAAVARERVMLESKSWRLTSPLRGARRKVTNAAAVRRAQAPAAAPLPPPAAETTPADQRRHRALMAKVAAAASRRS